MEVTSSYSSLLDFGRIISLSIPPSMMKVLTNSQAAIWFEVIFRCFRLCGVSQLQDRVSPMNSNGKPNGNSKRLAKTKIL